MSIWGTLGEVAVGTVTGAIAGPGGAIIGGAATLSGGVGGSSQTDFEAEWYIRCEANPVGTNRRSRMTLN